MRIPINTAELLYLIKIFKYFDAFAQPLHSKINIYIHIHQSRAHRPPTAPNFLIKVKLPRPETLDHKKRSKTRRKNFRQRVGAPNEKYKIKGALHLRICKDRGY